MTGGCEIIVIGASWGGLAAVGRILEGLPEDFPVPILIVQHRSKDASDLLSGLLSRRGPLNVVEVEDKAPLQPGCVHLAPPGYHVLVEPGWVVLSTEAAVNFSRPSIDVALESAADAYGPAAVGVVLTGSNADGAAGLAELRRRGGTAIVQNPATAERTEMPRAAEAAAHPQFVSELADIPPLLVRLAHGEVVA